MTVLGQFASKVGSDLIWLANLCPEEVTIPGQSSDDFRDLFYERKWLGVTVNQSKL